MTTRDEALALLHEYTKTDSLRRHAYAVEAAMRAYAKKFGADEERFGITGLLHDFDYEKYPTPTEHTIVGAKILADHRIDDDIIYAIRAHADYNGLPRDTLLAKSLYACDELSGFIVAVAMVKPTRSVADVETKSVRKKLKDKAFARGVNRDDVVRGAAELGVELDDHIAFVIQALTAVAAQLGLDGSASAAQG